MAVPREDPDSRSSDEATTQGGESGIEAIDPESTTDDDGRPVDNPSG